MLLDILWLVLLAQTKLAVISYYHLVAIFSLVGFGILLFAVLQWLHSDGSLNLYTKHTNTQYQGMLHDDTPLTVISENSH